jgi:hypothetical protein
MITSLLQNSTGATLPPTSPTGSALECIDFDFSEKMENAGTVLTVNFKFKKQFKKGIFHFIELLIV